MQCRLLVAGLLLVSILGIQVGGCPPADPRGSSAGQVEATTIDEGATTEPNTVSNVALQNGGSISIPDFSNNEPVIPTPGDPVTVDPNTGDPNASDPNSGDPNNGDPNTGDPNSGDPNDPNVVTRLFNGSGVYQGSVTCDVAQTIFPGDPAAQTTNSSYDQTLMLDFDEDTGAISGLPTFGYINTPNITVALATPGHSVILSTFDNLTPVTLTVTLTSLNYTATSIHAVLALDHHGELPNGYSETATGVETIDIALVGGEITFSATTTYDAVLSAGSLVIPNQVIISSAATMTP